MTAIGERFSIAGRRALVTGASKAIGAEICRLFAGAGADIVALARDLEGLSQISNGLTARGRKCLAIEADLSTRESPVHAANEALRRWRAAGIPVNSAGVALTAPPFR